MKTQTPKTYFLIEIFGPQQAECLHKFKVDDKKRIKDCVAMFKDSKLYNRYVVTMCEEYEQSASVKYTSGEKKSSHNVARVKHNSVGQYTIEFKSRIDHIIEEFSDLIAVHSNHDPEVLRALTEYARQIRKELRLQKGLDKHHEHMENDNHDDIKR